jgi:hypothetical protein
MTSVERETSSCRSNALPYSLVHTSPSVTKECMMSALFIPDLGERCRENIAPGAALILDWLRMEQQAWIVDQFH